ncbi:MAG TPA: VanZ family protein [Chthoniobacterales bacterium]
MRTFLKYWLPVIVWIAMISTASTDLMSAQHTSRFIGPFLLWLMPDIAPHQIVAVQFAVRKAAHVTEYAILAALLLRAFAGPRRFLRWKYAMATLLIVAGCASLDEYHQSFVASRTGALGDVLIDCSGALLGVAVCAWIVSRRRRRIELPNDVGAQHAA